MTRALRQFRRWTSTGLDTVRFAPHVEGPRDLFMPKPLTLHIGISLPPTWRGQHVGPKGILNSFPRWQTVSGPGMTRTSFVAASKAYLTAMRPYYRPSTLEWWRRNFTTIRADLEILIEDGSIKRTTPSQIGDKDI